MGPTVALYCRSGSVYPLLKADHSLPKDEHSYVTGRCGNKPQSHKSGYKGSGEHSREGEGGRVLVDKEAGVAKPE